MTTPGATGRFGVNLAPGGLALAQQLANTVGVGQEPDLLGSAPAAQHWLESAGGDGRALHDADLERMRSLRAAVRAALGSDADDRADADEQAAAEPVLRLRIGTGGISWQSGSDPVDALESRVASALVEAQARGELPRLKLCANPRCRVAFFDASRNGAGRWHSSETCGNAARVRAHRERSAASIN